MVEKVFKLKVDTIKVLLIGLALFTLLDIFIKFGFIRTNIFGSLFIPILTSALVLVELGIKQIIKRKKKLDIIESFGFVTAVLVFLIVIASLFFSLNSTFQSIFGFGEIILLVYLLIETFVK
ncbi:MAG: hypothetical protein AABY22_13710 [Nanoarchaeota archaeon]